MIVLWYVMIFLIPYDNCMIFSMILHDVLWCLTCTDILWYLWVFLNLSVGQEIRSHPWIPSKTFGCAVVVRATTFTRCHRTARIFAPLKIQWISSCGEFEVRWDDAGVSAGEHITVMIPQKVDVAEPENIHLKLLFNVWNYEGQAGKW